MCFFGNKIGLTLNQANRSYKEASQKSFCQAVKHLWGVGPQKKPRSSSSYNLRLIEITLPYFCCNNRSCNNREDRMLLDYVKVSLEVRI